MIHTYSLIHDDLPAIDNDDYRRDQLSCHKKFEESTAILTGNALLIFAFEILSTSTALSDRQARLIISKLTQVLGFNGMMYGQLLDIEATNKKISLSTIEEIHYLKTAKFMSISCVIGALAGNASETELQNIEIFGNHLGMLFQITDDLLDLRDKDGNECNIANLLTIDEIKQLLDQHTDKAISALNQIKERDIDLLKNLLFFLKNRTT
jgi:geranylgeranyl pyrophosphate synthase